MKPIKIFLEKYGIHSFLVPVFFIIHNYVQYYGAVTPGTALKIFILIEIFFTVFVLLLYFFWKNSNASLAVTTFLGILYLLFGNIKEMLASGLHLFFVSRYAVFLPMMILCIVVYIVVIRKKKNFNNLNLYLNILLIIFIITDCLQLPSLNGIFTAGKQSLLANRTIYNDKLLTTSFRKKDIYYLLFDSYPNCTILKNNQPPGSFSLDTFLLNRNFYVIKNSKCNYNNTAFSMDATLNMAYLERLHNPDNLTPMEYDKAIADINHAAIFNYMAGRGYKIYNLSAFTVRNSPPLYKQQFATLLPGEMFMYFTFLPCIKRDLLWHITKHFPTHSGAYINSPAFNNEKELNEGKLYYNNKLLDSVPKIPADTSVEPRFVYAHFFMPHYPYFYDENGKKYSDTGIYNMGLIYNDKKFINYVNYTNKKIAGMLAELLSKTGAGSIVIVQSDHGYRGFAKTDINNHFKNLSAVYFPNHDYSGLYDSMTNVNTFRVLLNKYFSEKIPLLPDAVIVLKD